MSARMMVKHETARQQEQSKGLDEKTTKRPVGKEQLASVSSHCLQALGQVAQANKQH